MSQTEISNVLDNGKIFGNLYNSCINNLYRIQKKDNISIDNTISTGLTIHGRTLLRINKIVLKCWNHHFLFIMQIAKEFWILYILCNVSFIVVDKFKIILEIIYKLIKNYIENRILRRKFNMKLFSLIIFIFKRYSTKRNKENC